MSKTELRWQLRQLPREIDPPHDLWPGIQARLRPPQPARKGRAWWVGLAMAASLCLAVGLAWQPARSPAPDPQAALVQREAQALTREYQAALVQFEGAPLPAPIEPALATLDQSLVQIRQAMDSDPGARYLLDQLRRTYSRRLSLTQRAVTG
ncbi:MAG: hypothetical protein DCF27_08065 [Lysobacteraceae bacterium]|nr:MAG: hypothetical protein DCF27_08065 [Xanthomonadaceae bacterium]